jgi:hypothetical protein
MSFPKFVSLPKEIQGLIIAEFFRSAHVVLRHQLFSNARRPKPGHRVLVRVLAPGNEKDPAPSYWRHGWVMPALLLVRQMHSVCLEHLAVYDSMSLSIFLAGIP